MGIVLLLVTKDQCHLFICRSSSETNSVYLLTPWEKYQTTIVLTPIESLVALAVGMSSVCGGSISFSKICRKLIRKKISLYDTSLTITVIALYKVYMFISSRVFIVLLIATWIYLLLDFNINYPNYMHACIYKCDLTCCRHMTSRSK